MILEALSKTKWLFFLLAAPILAWFTQAESGNETSLPAPTSVNLALRRTGDKLLRLSGDSLSRIPVVEQKSATVWHLRLEQPFRYELLPSILDSAFQVHKIKLSYEVSVRNCTDSVIVLGYHHVDAEENQIPCGGRDTDSACKFIELSFHHPVAPTTPKPIWPYLLSGLFGVIALARWWYGKTKEPTASDSDAVSAHAPETVWIHFGSSRFDPARQVLEQQGQSQKLTYREAKLLAFLAERQNQLVERDMILQHVWTDEGIQVSRSVDMFISRLRKKLATDTSLRIVAVHGVGYRFEVDG